MLIIDTPETETFWRKICDATVIDSVTPHHIGTFAKPADVEVPTFADELARMACDGKQRGTPHMQLDFDHGNIRMREPGDGWIVMTDVGEPLCVVRVTNAGIKPFNRVGDVFAASEGEADLSLDQWRDDRTVACASLELVSRP